MDRRRALGLLGAGMGAVVLGGACRADDAGSGTTATAGRATSPTSGTAPGVGPVTVGVEAFGAAAACALTPEQTEGPFYLDVDSVRRDIREDRPGAALRVAVRVLDADGCTPVRDAVFEIWHCDADGRYSGFEGASAGGPGRGGGGGPAVGDTCRYLRGAQITDTLGIRA